MKNYLAVLAALAVATPITAQTSFGVRGGMTLSTFAPSEEDEEIEVAYLTGIHLDVGGRDAIVEALYGFGILSIIDDSDESVRNRGFTIRAGVDFGR